MKTYKCDSCRSIQASSLSEAARLAAERIARRNYGRRAEVGALRADSYSQDGSFFPMRLSSADRIDASGASRAVTCDS